MAVAIFTFSPRLDRWANLPFVYYVDESNQMLNLMAFGAINAYPELTADMSVAGIGKRQQKTPFILLGTKLYDLFKNIIFN